MARTVFSLDICSEWVAGGVVSAYDDVVVIVVRFSRVLYPPN